MIFSNSSAGSPVLTSAVTLRFLNTSIAWGDSLSAISTLGIIISNPLLLKPKFNFCSIFFKTRRVWHIAWHMVPLAGGKLIFFAIHHQKERTCCNQPVIVGVVTVLLDHGSGGIAGEIHVRFRPGHLVRFKPPAIRCQLLKFLRKRKKSGRDFISSRCFGHSRFS